MPSSARMFRLAESKRGTAEQENSLPRELRLFCVVVAISTLTTWAIVLIALARHAGYPYDWPYFQPGNSFHDYYDYFKRFRQPHTAGFFNYQDYPFTYAAPGVILYRLLYGLGIAGGLLLYLVIAVALLWVGCRGVYRAMLRRCVRKSASIAFVLTALVTSYPIFFCVERGNLELVIAGGVALGFYAYWQGRTLGAAVIWGIAGTVKFYPLLLLAVFLSLRQYKQFFMGVLAAVATTLVSLLYIGPDLRTATHGILFGLSTFVKTYSLAYDAFYPCSPQSVCLTWRMGFDHSIFNLIKTLTLRPVAELPAMLHVYLLAAGILALLFYLVRARKLPVANQLLFLTVCSVLLPPTSLDYTLVQLYAPFAVLVLIACDAARQGRRLPGLGPMLVSLAFIFTPTNFIFVKGAGLGGQLKCVVLMVLIAQSLWFPLETEAKAS